jgi:hypothetical protein
VWFDHFHMEIAAAWNGDAPFRQLLVHQGLK